MSLVGVGKRLPFEDARFTDQEVVLFRRLYQLSHGGAEKNAQMKREVTELAKTNKSLPKQFAAYIKDAGPHQIAITKIIQENYAKQAELMAQLEKEQAKVAQLDARLAALDVKEDALLVQYGKDLGKKLAAAPAMQPAPQNTPRQTTTVKF